jgi:GT2 family glycosyltransferase
MQELLDSTARPIPHGKFFQLEGEAFLLKGVTYGTFAPDARGGQFPSPASVAEDFALMAEYGINTVRPRSLVDEAVRHGLRLMVGIPWAQHVAFLDDGHLRTAVRRDVVATVRSLADHPGVLLFALGNEIPAAVVRWHGRHRTERFIRELYEEAKSAAPDATFTYVNFPPTEYLELPFLDVCAFNVYLHDEGNLRRYVARLQHIAGNRPLLLAEAGADSIRHGEHGQARLTAMQLRASFAEGACGAIAFAWTDEWWRGGYSVEDWSFGLVDRNRRPKPALDAVADVFADAPFSAEEQRQWPKISVVICAYNAASTLEDCLSSLERLTYPNYEVLIINDGSRDDTGAIARRHPSMRLVEVPNGGLSRARNIGLAHATGDIVAYTDADVRVEPHWLTYLAQPFLTSDVVACGGPNVAPPDDPWLARAVALSPGGPTHVLADDRIAEHVPGCNFAVRREALAAISGFNPIYLRAGDDVDVCWRLQARGGRIGFAPAALVWHHHRPSLKAYWRQQVGYGEGEAWLAPHHPDKFVGGRIKWHGHIYSPLPFIRSLTTMRVNAGTWGTAAFPSVYHPGVNPFTLLPHSFAWMSASFGLVVTGLALALATDQWMVALVCSLIGAFGVTITILRAVRCAWRTDVRTLPSVPGRSPAVGRAMVRGVIAWLHIVQPVARQYGWFRGRFLAAEDVASHPAPVSPSAGRLPEWADLARAVQLLIGEVAEDQFWGEVWTSGDAVLTRLVKRLRGSRVIRHVAVDDGWQQARDVSAPVGWWGWLDVRALIEDHGSGKSLLRVSHRLRVTPVGVAGMAGAGAALGAVLALNVLPEWPVTPITVAVLGLVMARGCWQLTAMIRAVRHAMSRAAEDVHMQPVPQSAQTTAEHVSAFAADRPQSR